MDLKTMFPNLTVMWTRWSDYHVISQYGMHFLVPTPDATSLTYDCTQQPGSLVADALDLGRQLAANTQEADSLCASFAAHYGLLGLDYTGDTYGAAQGYELPASMCPLNSQKYGDDLGQFQMTFIELYQHFCTVRGEEYPAAGSKFLDLSGVGCTVPAPGHRTAAPTRGGFRRRISAIFRSCCFPNVLFCSFIIPARNRSAAAGGRRCASPR